MTPANIRTRKQQLRQTALTNRNKQADRDDLSRRIVGAVMALPEFATASTVMFYVDIQSEVGTRRDLPAALDSGRTIVVPWCTSTGTLELFRLESIDELDTGMYGIPEPRAELRQQPEKQVAATEPDLIIVPGVGFDERGARLGRGRGYYDQLLQHARPDASLVALAFECQMFDEIPVAAHDVFMHKIITEDRVLDGRGSRSVPAG